jgi:hypothetical protein
MFLRDPETLGKWGHKQEHTGTYERRLAGYTALLDLSRKAGLVRTDMEMREQLYLLSVLSIGMLMADAWLPDEVKISDEQAVEVVSETVKRTLETPSSTPEDWAVVTREFDKYMEQVVEDLAKDQATEDNEG